MPIQAVLFPIEYGVVKAKKWLKENHLYPIKRVHKTVNKLRYRISEPIYRRYTIKHIGDIELVIGY